MHWALQLDGASPLRMPSAFSVTGYCVRRPSALGSEPRRCEPVAHAERVQRDRVLCEAAQCTGL